MKTVGRMLIFVVVAVVLFIMVLPIHGTAMCSQGGQDTPGTPYLIKCFVLQSAVVNIKLHKKKKFVLELTVVNIKLHKKGITLIQLILSLREHPTRLSGL